MPRSTALNDNDRGAPVVAAKNKANNWVANHGRDFAQHKLKQNGVNQVKQQQLSARRAISSRGTTGSAIAGKRRLHFLHRKFTTRGPGLLQYFDAIAIRQHWPAPTDPARPPRRADGDLSSSPSRPRCSSARWGSRAISKSPPSIMGDSTRQFMSTVDRITRGGLTNLASR